MFFTKALIINNMALIWDGRVLVVNAPLVIGAYPPTLLDVQNADAENERHQPFQNCSSL